MAKASPLISAFNGGEWSPLMEGRTNLEQSRSAVRKMVNMAGTSQGPGQRRSGTKFIAPQWDHDNPGRMIEFEFSANDTIMCGFENQRMRLLSRDGVVLRLAGTPVLQVLSVSPTFVLRVSPGHGIVPGEEVFFGGFDPSTRLFQAFGRVSGVSGPGLNDIAITGASPPVGLTLAGGETLARVFHIATPYTTAKLPGLRAVSSTATLFLFEGTTRTQVLKRNSTYDWPIRPFGFKDGPYLSVNETATTLTPTSTGRVGTNPASAFASSTAGGSSPGNAFDTQVFTGWVSGSNQGGELGYDFGVPTALRGYVLRVPVSSGDASHTAKDFAPSTWFMLGSNDGVNYSVLDAQTGYVLYTNSRSVFFKFKGAEPNFRFYKLSINACVGNGAIAPIVHELIFVPSQTHPSTLVTFNASSTVGINDGQGFLPTDVGRVIRHRADDQFWRWYTIFQVNSPTQIVTTQEADPLPDLNATTEWRLGIFSDTTGWPTCGFFFDDRMIIAGGEKNPDLVCGSVVGSYETFSPTDPDGVVTDLSGWVVPLNGRKVGVVQWIQADSRGLLVGTLNGPWLIRSIDSNAVLTAKTAKARPLNGRGCAPRDPIQVDDQLLFVPRSENILRELAYNYNSEGYKAPSMSLFASHLGASKFKRFVFAAEPHSILWTHRQDGLLVGFTYNREEEVIGWHRHPIGGAGFVEDLAVLPSADTSKDELWLSVRRTIEGQTRRYFEILQPFWDFTTTLDNCWFVDCGFIYEGPPVTTVSGLWSLEGREVSILADGIPITPQTVTDGKIELPSPHSRVVVGFGYVTEGETLRPEAGAADGTSQGKTKRIHKSMLRLWDTVGGEIGRPDFLQPIEMRKFDDEVGSRIDPQTGDFGPIDFDGDYDSDATIAFRQTEPLPFNIVGIYPQIFTQDGR